VAGSLAFFGAPLLGGAVVGEAPQPNRRQTFLDRWLPGSLGGLAGFAAFHGIGAASGGSLQRLPYIWPSSLGEDLGTLSAGALGGVIGCGLARLAGTAPTPGPMALVAAADRFAAGGLHALVAVGSLRRGRPAAAPAGRPELK
jgi:hypothetical protein